jgi:cell division GTPase FtsZ
MTAADTNDSVSAVRGRVGPDAHVIWGGAIDDTLDELRVRLVLAGVKNVRVAAGDRCPRCGSALSTYRLDGRGVPSCESCGFAGVSVRLRD